MTRQLLTLTADDARRADAKGIPRARYAAQIAKRAAGKRPKPRRPTVRELEERVAALERERAALLLATGANDPLTALLALAALVERAARATEIARQGAEVLANALGAEEAVRAALDLAGWTRLDDGDRWLPPPPITVAGPLSLAQAADAQRALAAAVRSPAVAAPRDFRA